MSEGIDVEFTAAALAPHHVAANRRGLSPART